MFLWLRWWCRCWAPAEHSACVFFLLSVQGCTRKAWLCRAFLQQSSQVQRERKYVGKQPHSLYFISFDVRCEEHSHKKTDVVKSNGILYDLIDWNTVVQITETCESKWMMQHGQFHFRVAVKANRFKCLRKNKASIYVMSVDRIYKILS